MGDIHLRKYGVATTVDFALYKIDGTALKTDASSASGDVTLYRDEAGVETLDADAFTDEGAIYSLALSATEMEAARIIIAVVDQTNPQVWLDKTIIVETYGNASAQHVFDLASATVNLSAASEGQIDAIETDTNELQGLITDSKIASQVKGLDNIDLSATMKTSVATALLTAVVEGTLTAQSALKLITAATAGKLSGGGSATLKFRDTTNSKDRITATVDANGNRTAVTLDVT